MHIHRRAFAENGAVLTLVTTDDGLIRVCIQHYGQTTLHGIFPTYDAAEDAIYVYQLSAAFKEPTHGCAEVCEKCLHDMITVLIDKIRWSCADVRKRLAGKTLLEAVAIIKAENRRAIPHPPNMYLDQLISLTLEYGETEFDKIIDEFWANCMQLLLDDIEDESEIRDIKEGILDDTYPEPILHAYSLIQNPEFFGAYGALFRDIIAYCLNRDKFTIEEGVANTLISLKEAAEEDFERCWHDVPMEHACIKYCGTDEQVKEKFLRLVHEGYVPILNAFYILMFTSRKWGEY